MLKGLDLLFKITVVDTDLGSIPNGTYIFFVPFSKKYTGDLTGNVVDSMMNAEGWLYFTGWGLVDRSLATGLVSWLQIGNDGRMW